MADKTVKAIATKEPEVVENVKAQYVGSRPGLGDNADTFMIVAFETVDGKNIECGVNVDSWARYNDKFVQVDGYFSISYAKNVANVTTYERDGKNVLHTGNGNMLRGISPSSRSAFERAVQSKQERTNITTVVNSSPEDKTALSILLGSMYGKGTQL